jgi:hypothetical protein
VIRPTIEGLGKATDDLEELAWNCTAKNENGFHHIAELLHLLVSIDGEVRQHRKDAGWGPGGERSPEGGGTVGSHTIGRHGLNRPVEERLEWGTEDPQSRHQRGGELQPPVEPNDRAYQEFRKLQHEVTSTLTSTLAALQHKADKVGGYRRTG